MSQRKLIKLKHEADSHGVKIDSIGLQIDSVGLQIQQFTNDLLSLKLDMKREVRQPLFSNKGCKEDNEVDWDLLPKFDECKDEQDEH